ncbi:MAG: hypothetical protein K9G67_05295 [Bacteroidales bacterium]|nr:hypothetical protein [Bacteroidales bacterium]MCF8343280.1 hypothetical protein [Bacteroidales bacterium]MCF8350852.1 hypothetical protein [Bacteroidales bacterium]MCF8375749.1 hypothetical protein [Bacteroidales bacterium]MCF8400349.1 hypothetical protein [Bacteroidales bacterium]
MKKVFFLSIILLVLSTLTKTIAQVQTENSFKPAGEPIIKVFSNFHTSISEGTDKSALEIKRAYFGYLYNLSPNFSVVAKLDIGSPDDKSAYSLIKRYAYFKNAALIYENGNLTASFGLIDLKQFKLQEKFWGYRYIYKSFMDEYRFGNSADIGGSIGYKINETVSVDFTIMNGEGYVQLQADNTYKGGWGITLRPLHGLVARFYYDLSRKDLSQSTLASFIGYEYERLFKLGAEYNLKRNESYIENHNQEGLSVYGTVFINEHFQAFGRYDRLTSNMVISEDRPWNLIEDGTAIIGGVQYSPIRQVRIALNYQDWYPLAKNREKEAYIYLSFEYKID